MMSKPPGARTTPALAPRKGLGRPVNESWMNTNSMQDQLLISPDRGSWPGFESEPSSLERLILDHPLTLKPRTSLIRSADGESS
jgi:hypothetical protein